MGLLDVSQRQVRNDQGDGNVSPVSLPPAPPLFSLSLSLSLSRSCAHVRSHTQLAHTPAKYQMSLAILDKLARHSIAIEPYFRYFQSARVHQACVCARARAREFGLHLSLSMPAYLHFGITAITCARA